MEGMFVTVVETSVFLNRAVDIMTDSERQSLVDYLAGNPTAGEDLGSGVRKLRFATGGRGKRGSVRVVTFYADTRFPVFLLDVFAKSEKANYSQAELREVRAIANRIIGSYRKEARK